MNLWLYAGAAVSTALLPCADMCLRGPVERRLVGMEMAAFLAILTMVLFTVGFGAYGSRGVSHRHAHLFG